MNPAEMFDGRYRLEALIGTGGMAEVWLAEDERLGRPVALKILRESISREHDGDLISAIEREARVIARLQHPNIVSVYDAGQFESRHYLAMEYVDGASLRQLLTARGRLAENEATRIAIQVAGALDYAHRQGVVHNDVKPENIIVTSAGVAKVADFGVSETVTRTLSAEQARELLGTIAYLAPEVIQGSPPDARADVYSLALTIYECVAGRLPFTGPSPAAIASQRLAAPPPPLRAHAPEASASLEGVLARALEFAPGDRYQTAADLARALTSVPPQGSDGPAPAAGSVRPPPRGPARATAPVRHDTPLVRRTPPPPENSGSNAATITAIVAALLLAVGIGAVAAFALLGGDDNGGEGDATPTTTTATQEATERPTDEPSPRPTDEPSATPTPSPSPTTEPTETPTNEPTEEPDPTGTPTEEPGPTETPTP